MTAGITDNMSCNYNYMSVVGVNTPMVESGLTMTAVRGK